MSSYRGASYVQWREDGFDQGTGANVVWRERGVPSVIDGRAIAWKNAGYNVQMWRNAPYMELRAKKDSLGYGNTYVTRWTVTAETLEKPIWTLESVAFEMRNFAEGKAAYKKHIENAIDEGTALPSNMQPLSAANEVLREMRRGVEAYEHEYTLLNRHTTFQFRIPPQPLVLQPNNLLYTTAQLRANENIPTDVFMDLPTNADTQTDEDTKEVVAIWSWRIRDQEAEITNGLTGTHNTTWVYAQWSTFLYDYTP